MLKNKRREGRVGIEKLKYKIKEGKRKDLQRTRN
jgi:hypothetical protein